MRLPCSIASFQSLPKALATLGAHHALPALKELHLRLRFTDELQVGDPDGPSWPAVCTL
jgi:hypothetical protein